MAFGGDGDADVLEAHLRALKFSVTAACRSLRSGPRDAERVIAMEASIGGFSALVDDFQELSSLVREAAGQGVAVTPWDDGDDDAPAVGAAAEPARAGGHRSVEEMKTAEEKLQQTFHANPERLMTPRRTFTSRRGRKRTSIARRLGKTGMNRDLDFRINQGETSRDELFEAARPAAALEVGAGAKYSVGARSSPKPSARVAPSALMTIRGSASSMRSMEEEEEGDDVSPLSNDVVGPLSNDVVRPANPGHMLKRQNSYELHEMGSRLGMNAIDVPEDKGSPAASARNLKSTPARKSFGKDKAARHGGNRMRQTIVDGMAVMGALPKAAHRVSGAFAGHGSAAERLTDVLLELGREAPRSLVDDVLRARPPAPPGVNGDLLVELVVSVEERRTQIMLDAGRKECAELLEISGAEEFVRTVGEEDQMCLGLKMFHPKNDIIENFEILMMFNCNVGYVDDRGVVVMDRKMALKNYFQTWALIDIVSSVPIDRVMDAATEGKEDGGGVMGSKKILKLLRLVRMTKLVKLLRASQLVKKIRENLMAFMEFYKIFVSDATLKLWRLFFMMLTLSHWGSCLMFILLKAYKYPLRVAYQEFPTAQVCESSHGWCVIESWMTLVGVFAGCFFNAIFVSTITSILVSMDVSMQDSRDRIRDYYHHRWKEGVIFDESLILERLNPELCLEILNYKIRDLVPKVPLLRTTPKAFSEALAPAALHPTVTTEGDVVLKEGDYGDAMYFIDKGLAEVLVEAVGDQVVKLIADGCFFGEAACLLKVKRTATIRCKHLMSSYTVSSEDMDEVLEDHPEILKYITRVARSRIDRLQLLHLNAHLNEGTAGLMSTDDDEDARTPLFVSLAAKHRAEQAGTVAARVRHSLANIYQKGSSMVGGGSMTNGTRSSRASNRAASQRAGGPSSKHVMVQPGSMRSVPEHHAEDDDDDELATHRPPPSTRHHR
ncbi:voltage-gated potassium channel [Aureococcus anophagefferens]|nr:voltage-gated potassium channel [Aureococcus anophagefferens]